MDDESKLLLCEIRDLQREQIELLRASFHVLLLWMTWRFSLRTLFIAMTQIAVLMGIIAVSNYAIRN